MGNSNQGGDCFDRAAENAYNNTYAKTGDPFQATAACTAAYAQKAFYESGSGGPTPQPTSVGEAVFDLATASVAAIHNSYGNKKN